MPKIPPGSSKRAHWIDALLSVCTGATPFAVDRASTPDSEYDGGLGSTWILEGPYSLTTCALRVPDGSGDVTGAAFSDVAVIYRRFLCTPFGTLVLEPAARFDPWFADVDARRFDALTWARDFSPLPFTPFMRDFDAALVGKGIERFFRRLGAKQRAMRAVHGAVPVLGQIPYGLREAVLHACAHDSTGALVRLADEAPKVFVALGACLGDRPDRWVVCGPDGKRLADPLQRLAAGASPEASVAEALGALTGDVVDRRVVDDLLFLARFVTSAAPDNAWLVARALLGVDRRNAPESADAAVWAPWLRTLRPGTSSGELNGTTPSLAASHGRS